MKKILLSILCFGLLAPAYAQSMKGKAVDYFQAPSVGLNYEFADVYLSADEALIKQRTQATSENQGGFFGGVAAFAGGMQAEATKAAIDAVQDKEGRFAVWNFVPDYIKVDKDMLNAKRIVVEILIMHEDISSTELPTSQYNGYYSIPYKTSCRYKVMDKKGNLIFENNLGLLEGKQKTKNYTPPATQTTSSGMTISTPQDKDKNGLTAPERIGINKAYQKVRQDVYSRYGFGGFTANTKLASIKEMKTASKMLKTVVKIFENKGTLLLTDKDKVTVQQYIDLLEKEAGLCKEKNQWALYHNLSVCYAWVENEAKANESYVKYGSAIQGSLDKIKNQEAVMNGTAKSGTGGFIGMKDMKKVSSYKDIAAFVEHYPRAVNNYRPLFYAINRNLKQFVDYYNYNDFLCQLYSLDYPYQFFPINKSMGAPKAIEGSISRDGREPITYKIKLNSKKGQIKSLQVEQTALTATGKKDKLKTKTLEPIYHSKYGYHQGMEANATSFWDVMDENSKYRDPESLTYSPDKIALSTVSKTLGVINDKSSGNIFMGTDKVIESYQRTQLQVDLEGTLYFKGKSRCSRMNSLFKDILDDSGILYKAPDTRTNFVTTAKINGKGVLTLWDWTGDVSSKFNTPDKQNPTGSLSAKKMARKVTILEEDDKGHPTKVNYVMSTSGDINIKAKLTWKLFWTSSSPNVTSDTFELDLDETWDATYSYDEVGNWTQMELGPYTATRTIKY